MFIRFFINTMHRIQIDAKRLTRVKGCYSVVRSTIQNIKLRGLLNVKLCYFIDRGLQYHLLHCKCGAVGMELMIFYP